MAWIKLGPLGFCRSLSTKEIQICLSSIYASQSAFVKIGLLGLIVHSLEFGGFSLSLGPCHTRARDWLATTRQPLVTLEK